MPAGKTISAIINNARLLRYATDYAISGNLLTIKKEYFSTAEVGLKILSCIFSTGSAQNIAVNVIDTANSSISPASAVFDKNPSAQSDIAVKMELYSNSLSAIKNSTAGIFLSGGLHYSTSETGLVLIKKEYFYNLANGINILEFIFTSGSPQTLSVNVIDSSRVAAPVFSLPGGAYDEPQKIYLTTETPNSVIYYTLDGTTPTTSSSVYSGSLEILVSSALKAIAFKPGMTISAVSQAYYIINKLPPPVFDNIGAIIPMNAGSAGNEGNMPNTINSKLASASDKKIKIRFKTPPLSGILTLSMSDDDNFPSKFATFQAYSYGTTSEILFSLATSELNLRKIFGDEDIIGLNLKVKLVSFEGTESVYAVKKKTEAPVINYEAPKWQYLGGSAVSDSAAGTCSIYVQNSVPYIAFADSLRSNKVTVKKYFASSNTWGNVGTPGFTPTPASNLTLKFINGSPLLVYSSATGSGEIRLLKFNGGSWENATNVASPATSESRQFSAAVCNSHIYLAYPDSSNSSRAKVILYDGNLNLWNQTFWASTGPVEIFSKSVAVQEDQSFGSAFLSYSDLSDNHKVRIVRTSGADYGSVPVEVGYGIYNNYIIDGANHYVSFYDGNAYSMKLSGNSWNKLGTGHIASGAKPLDTFAYNGEIYAGFTDLSKNYNGSVKKFNGSYWKNVGNSGFAVGGNGNALKAVSLSASEQRCYFAYIDSFSGKAVVMYYDLY